MATAEQKQDVRQAGLPHLLRTGSPRFASPFEGDRSSECEPERALASRVGRGQPANGHRACFRARPRQTTYLGRVPSPHASYASVREPSADRRPEVRGPGSWREARPAAVVGAVPLLAAMRACSPSIATCPSSFGAIICRRSPALVAAFAPPRWGRSRGVREAGRDDQRRDLVRDLEPRAKGVSPRRRGTLIRGGCGQSQSHDRVIAQALRGGDCFDRSAGRGAALSRRARVRARRRARTAPRAARLSRARDAAQPTSGLPLPLPARAGAGRHDRAQRRRPAGDARRPA